MPLIRVYGGLDQENGSRLRNAIELMSEARTSPASETDEIRR